MAWANYKFSSIVDDIFKRGSYSLEDFLDEDETVADTKDQKAELVEFLSTSSVVDDLLTYLVENPPTDASDKEKFRYPAVACEILCAGADSIERTLIDHEENLERLFGFFEEQKINLLLAGCVVKVINTLISNKTAEVFQYLKKNIDFIDGFLNHLESAASTDFFARLISVNNEAEDIGTVAWLIEVGFVDELFKRFEKDYIAIHHDIAQSAIDIMNAATWNSAISDKMMDVDSFSLLIEIMLEPDNPSGLIYGSKVVNKIIRNIVQINDDPEEKRKKVEITAPMDELNQPVQIVVQNFNNFVELLKTPPKNATKSIIRSDNSQVQAFGFFRLQLLSMVDTLLLLNYRAVVTEMAEHESLVPTIVDFLFQFDHNTFVHKIVERFIIRVLQQMAIFNIDHVKLLERVKLPERLISAHLENQKLIANSNSSNSSNNSSSNTNTKTKQYMPIIYSVGECLYQISEADDTFKELMNKCTGWKDFQEFILERRLKLEVPPEIEPAGKPGKAKLGSDEDGPPPTPVTFDTISDEVDKSNSSYIAGQDGDEKNFELKDTDDMPSEDDIDDFDIEQAEIMLTKQEVQALG